MAARGLISLYREVNPALLKKKDLVVPFLSSIDLFTHDWMKYREKGQVNQ